MAQHFTRDEFDARMDRLQDAMAEARLGAMLLFSQESLYWLTGYDSFGYAFFQCLVVTAKRRLSLLVRAPDLAQARHTSIVDEILVWADRADADPTRALKDHLFELDLLGSKIGVEFDSVGLTAHVGRRLEDQLRSFATLEDVSECVPRLRAVKSPAEIAYVREAAALADRAFEAGLAQIRPGAAEAAVVAAIQGTILSAGGDYPAHEAIVGAGDDALLLRARSGRRTIAADDQVTMSFAGVWRRYHAAMMDTVIVGAPRPQHETMWEAASEALAAAVGEMRTGVTFGEVFDAHAEAIFARDLNPHRFNTCGTSLGASFPPTFLDWPMVYHGSEFAIAPGMVIFAHVILVDQKEKTAITIGRTYLTTEADAEPLSAIAPTFLRT